MRILTVCRGARNSRPFDLARQRPFIHEQVASLRARGHNVDVFHIDGPSRSAYVRAYSEIRERTVDGSYDVVHAHFALSGAPAVFASMAPVVVTFHGSDVNRRATRGISRAVARRAAWSIFVSNELRRLARRDERCTVLPCGVDLDTFVPIEQGKARRELGLSLDERVVVFGGAFASRVKNGALALAAAGELPGYRMLELKGYTRAQVNLLLNAADVLLVTSKREGSPQVVKEALAVNTRIVATPAGDIPEHLADLSGCEIVEPDVRSVVEAVRRVCDQPRPDSRARMEGLSLPAVAAKVEEIYRTVLSAEVKN